MMKMMEVGEVIFSHGRKETKYAYNRLQECEA